MYPAAMERLLRAVEEAESRPRGWKEAYRCGCVSPVATRKRDLPGYCGKHGDDRKGDPWPCYWDPDQGAT